MPVVCIEKSCSKNNVQFFDGRKMCQACGGEMFPVETKQQSFEDATFDGENPMIFSDDMLERMSAGAFIRAQSHTPTVVKHDDTFRCSPDLKGCPIAKSAKVYVPIDMYNKWIFLAGQLQTEWIAYLKGEQVEGKPDEYKLTDMYFPNQKASGAHCEAEDGEIQEGTIAAVHSHVGMGVFFSAEDQAHFNHQIELVVNNKGEILAIGRTQLECGRFHRGNAEIIFVGCEEELALEEQLRGKISKETSRFVTTTSRVDGQQTILSLPD